jgi:hypothetical protein
MLICRTASRIVGALVVASALVIPATAFAATAPVLENPAAGASSFKEGAAMKFEWRGTLQGDPDTLGRSFFRLEIIKSADMPSGAQAEWTNLENFFPTEPGKNATEVEIGVPNAGSYRWRVCAWGVVDDVVANEIVQLPGGCSASRAFTTSAAAETNQTPGELKVEERVQVAGGVKTVYVDRPNPAAPQPATPAPVTPAQPEPKVEAPAPEEPAPVTFTKLVDNAFGSGKSASSVGGLDGQGSSPFTAEKASSREGLSGHIMNGLSYSLPFVPIPFWTLALLLACLPIAKFWRGSVLQMFDWNDGTIDGSGGYADEDDSLATVPVVSDLKTSTSLADADAPAPVGTSYTSAPERGRQAA